MGDISRKIMGSFRRHHSFELMLKDLQGFQWAKAKERKGLSRLHFINYRDRKAGGSFREEHTLFAHKIAVGE